MPEVIVLVPSARHVKTFTVTPNNPHRPWQIARTNLVNLLKALVRHNKGRLDPTHDKCCYCNVRDLRVATDYTLEYNQISNVTTTHKRNRIRFAELRFEFRSSGDARNFVEQLQLVRYVCVKGTACSAQAHECAANPPNIRVSVKI